MAGDFSRKTFDPKKNYSGVLMQQGRVQLDADWNEQLDIAQYRNGTETKDVIGPSGVPKKGDAFKITPVAGIADLSITHGHMYVGGLLCETDGKMQPLSYLHQPYLPNPSLQSFTTATATAAASILKSGNYIVYIEAWQREINYLDDPQIHEVALGEADTAARLQTVWQVKLLPTGIVGGTCKSDYPEWNSLITPSTGKLNVITKAEETKTPCILPASAGYQRLENQLYRVEIQRGGANLANCTFKWSRDNATVETAITKIDGSVVTVASMGRDEILGFANGQWVEIVDEDATLQNTPQPLVQIVSTNPTLREITVSINDVPNKNNGKLKLRRWDNQGATAGVNGIPLSAAWTDIEAGIQVNFSAGSYKAGDYWLIPARTATGEVEWPPYEIPNRNPVAQAPIGVPHYFCKLAVLNITGAVAKIEDCRPKFPSLTEICATDICFDNNNCTFPTAKNVQEALDELCKKRDGKCTVTAVPGKGWDSVFKMIADGQDAQICFPVGDYPLEEPAIVKDKGHLTLVGCGNGTRILAPKIEAGVVFVACKNVVVRDLYVETGLADAFANLKTSLNGGLTFISCTGVNVSHVSAKCASGKMRAATCITVRTGIEKSDVIKEQTIVPCDVRIQNCDLIIGFRQQGILLVNVSHALVENNMLKGNNEISDIKLQQAMTDNQMRAGFTAVLVSHAKVGRRDAHEGIATVTLTTGNHAVTFKSHSSLKQAWQDVIKTDPPKQLETDADLKVYVNRTAKKILLDPTYRKKFSQFETLFNTLTRNYKSLGYQGITASGSTAKDVRILNNTVEGFLQGIHVGLSHRNNKEGDLDILGIVTIAGNTVRNILPADAKRIDRHGIFVGNCNTLIIENNNILLERMEGAERIDIDGITVWGKFGDRIMVTKNYVASATDDYETGYTCGIRIHPIVRKSGRAQWIATYNVSQGTADSIIVSRGAEETFNAG